MPKILINEIDQTAPGTSGNYSNYAVLIAGFTGDRLGEGNVILPDSNGVYEFSSAKDFKATIGLVAPGDEYKESGKDTPELKLYHYGNHMAYELLNLGYSILYLPIDKENGIEALTDASTWEIFKDRANYDFRFISHGLLETSDTTVLDNRIGELHTAIAVMNEEVLSSDDESLADEDKLIITSITEPDDVDGRLELAAAHNELYQALYLAMSDGTHEAINGLKDPNTGEYYASCYAAIKGVLTEIQLKTALLEKCITADTFAAANANIANLAKYSVDDATGISGRGDCIALIELNEKDYVNATHNPELSIIEAINKMDYINGANGKYCAMTVPSVVYKNGKKMPGAFHYLACFINALQSGFAEWYAAAGYTRGVSSYTIDRTTVTLGEIAINTLEPRNRVNDNSPKFACNVIANFRGSYYLWGNRTAQQLGSADGTDGDLIASHFLNIRQLCTTIKKQVYTTCRRYTFDPNSDTLWFNFVNAIRPTLDAMKADQGIRDYKVLKVPTDKKATLKAKIRIIPIEAVEDFDIEVSLEESFGETAAVVTE